MDGFVGAFPQTVDSVFKSLVSSGNPFSYILRLSFKMSSETFPKLMYKSPTWFNRFSGLIPVGKPSSLVME